jgi:hypothetical protein
MKTRLLIEEKINYETLTPGSLVMLFILMVIAILTISREINKRTGFPLTPILIFLGIVFGLT